jgi:hypothetical protein
MRCFRKDQKKNDLIFFSFIARTISRLLLERFLARMPRLRELELIVSSGGSPNLFDGDQWEIFIVDHLPFLTTFDFKFKIINIDHNKHDKESILARFHSPFWLDKNRHWYVAFNADDLVLYTVPRFAPRAIHATTLPIEQHVLLYHSVTELELGPDCKPSYRYTQVQKLTLLIPNIDENMIDISQVKYLCIKTKSWSLIKLVQLIRKSMPRLYHLKIDCDISWIKDRNIVPLEQIRVLELPHFFSSPKNDQVDFSFLFPRVQRLKIKVNTCHQMALLIDRLKYLSNGSFNIVNFQTDIKDKLREPESIRQWLIETLPRLATNNNFTVRLDSQSWLHLWIVDDNISNIPSTDAQLQTIKKDVVRRDHSRHCLLQ